MRSVKDVINNILFLASDESEHITGIDLKMFEKKFSDAYLFISDETLNSDDVLNPEISTDLQLYLIQEIRFFED
jgi:hypothetical protein